MPLYRLWHYADEGLLISSTEEERCGFVVKFSETELGYGLLEVQNIAHEPEKRFEMDVDTMVRVFNEHNVIGVWHTHPSGLETPSDMDLEWHPRQYDLYIVARARIHRYVPVGSRTFQKHLLPWSTAAEGERGQGS